MLRYLEKETPLKQIHFEEALRKSCSFGVGVTQSLQCVAANFLASAAPIICQRMSSNYASCISRCALARCVQVGIDPSRFTAYMPIKSWVYQVGERGGRKFRNLHPGHHRQRGAVGQAKEGWRFSQRLSALLAWHNTKYIWVCASAKVLTSRPQTGTFYQISSSIKIKK